MWPSLELGKYTSMVSGNASNQVENYYPLLEQKSGLSVYNTASFSIVHHLPTSVVTSSITLQCLLGLFWTPRCMKLGCVQLTQLLVEVLNLSESKNKSILMAKIACPKRDNSWWEPENQRVFRQQVSVYWNSTCPSSNLHMCWSGKIKSISC